MRLRKPCPHDRYEEHVCIDGRWVSQTRMMRITDDERKLLTFCPGGEFLPEGALVIEKVDGEWPDWALTILGEPPDIVRPSWTIRCLDALASQVGESER